MAAEKRLDKKVAVITGASEGIGRATAELFALEGATVILADINDSGLRETEAAIQSKGGNVAIKTTNVAEESEVKSLIEFCIKYYPRIDILCSNAGIAGNMSYMEPEKKTNWENIFAVNVLGTVYALKYVAPHMKRQASGAIVVTASIAGMRAGAGTNAYSASKAAVINLTQTVACDLGGYGIRVNAVCPGLIETCMTKQIFELARERRKEEKLGNRCELLRYGRPEEVANAILFLASDEASYITGQYLPIDGGNTASLNLPGMKF